MVDFTRDYESIRQALKTVEHYDKTCVENMLQAVKSILSTNWGSQNYSQVLVFTDMGIGFGATSIRALIETYSSEVTDRSKYCLPFSKSSKLSFVCLGNPYETYCKIAVELYQKVLDVSGQTGQIFVVRSADNNGGKEKKDDLGVTATLDVENVRSMIISMCEVNYKQFEATLKCGGFGKLETPIHIWPAPIVSISNILTSIPCKTNFLFFSFVYSLITNLKTPTVVQ